MFAPLKIVFFLASNSVSHIYLWACFFFVSITLVEYAFLNYYTIVIPRTKNESAAVNKNFSKAVRKYTEANKQAKSSMFQNVVKNALQDSSGSQNKAFLAVAENTNIGNSNFPTLPFDRRNDAICGGAKVEIIDIPEQCPEPIDDNANACTLFGRPMNSLMIDKYFRVIYATTFLVFNSIYWPYYQWLSSLHESGAGHD